MRHVRIVIRYYDERGDVVFEGEPTLGHAYRVPVRWIRWEIYWDEVLVESGERPTAAQASRPQAQERAGHRRAGDDPPPKRRGNGAGGPRRMAIPWALPSLP